MQAVLFGEGEIEPSKDNAMVLVEEFCNLDLPMQLCQKLALLDFESRKDAAQVLLLLLLLLLACLELPQSMLAQTAAPSSSSELALSA